MNTLRETSKNTGNFSPDEIHKFESNSARWWDPESEFKPLHEINPLRLEFILSTIDISKKSILDVGCGGGILSESMATKGAQVTGIDLGVSTLEVAKLHSLESGVNVNYVNTSVEEFSSTSTEVYDAITCMEMLEHVPDPNSVISSCAKLLKPGGHAFFSTLNRTPKSYLLAIIGAEYLLGMLPKGTHEFNKFICPSELDKWARYSGFEIIKLNGVQYNPLTTSYRTSNDVSVNYMVCYQKPE